MKTFLSLLSSKALMLPLSFVIGFGCTIITMVLLRPLLEPFFATLDRNNPILSAIPIIMIVSFSVTTYIIMDNKLATQPHPIYFIISLVSFVIGFGALFILLVMLLLTAASIVNIEPFGSEVGIALMFTWIPLSLGGGLFTYVGYALRKKSQSQKQ